MDRIDRIYKSEQKKREMMGFDLIMLIL